MNAHAQPLVNETTRAAHQAQQDSHRLQPPVSLHRVAFGQAFMLDSTPNLLFVRVRDDLPIGAVIPIVVIASAAGNSDLGRVIGLAPATTVRLVDVIVPCKVRWH